MFLEKRSLKKPLCLIVIFSILFSIPVFAQETIEITNPLEVETVAEFFEYFVEVLTVMGIALFSLVIVVAGGYIMLGGDSSENVRKGFRAIKLSVLGIIIIVFARALIEIVGWVLGIVFVFF